MREKTRAKNVNYTLTSTILVCLFCKTVSAQLQRAVNHFFPPFIRLHLCSAERHPLPRTDVCLRPLDLLPLQSVWQRHQGTGAAVCNVKTTCFAASHLMMLFPARSPFPWCRSLRSRRPKPPFWCQMLWWSQLQAIRSGDQLIMRSRLRNQDCKNNGREILRRACVEIFIFCGFCTVRVCVLPVPRQHLQGPDVHLSSSGGRTDAPPGSYKRAWTYSLSCQSKVLCFCHIGFELRECLFVGMCSRRRVHAAARFPPQLTTASGVRGHLTSIW